MPPVPGKGWEPAVPAVPAVPVVPPLPPEPAPVLPPEPASLESSLFEFPQPPIAKNARRAAIGTATENARFSIETSSVSTCKKRALRTAATTIRNPATPTVHARSPLRKLCSRRSNSVKCSCAVHTATRWDVIPIGIWLVRIVPCPFFRKKLVIFLHYMSAQRFSPALQTRWDGKFCPDKIFLTARNY